eukprot:TRINITY_DN32067_c0_g1_i1.p1 TRINITY_DN32067_c0_g1~~TRINITY_DN32067_c0_g1_i1.p1  ORF type:complete len:697 (+),score=270.22 TRINITY_DN32067_c0_g1_i1:90-2093(+)
MVFTVLVAADLFGAKLNYELDFPEIPPMASLKARIEAVFGAEAAVRRPAGAPGTPFQAHRMQTFDDNVELWVDLVAVSQLADYSQVYVFQRETPWHREVQSKIPPPTKPPPTPAPAAMIAPVAPYPQPVPVQMPIPVAPETSPRRVPSPHLITHRSPSPTRFPMPAGVPVAPMPAYAPPPRVVPAPAPVVDYQPPAFAPPPPEPRPIVAMRDIKVETTHGDKVRSVYDDLDQRRSGAVTADEFAAAFERLRIDSAGKTHSLYEKADANSDGALSFNEFERFSELYPTLLDSLFYRNRDYWLDRRQRDAIEAAQRRLDSLRERESDARAATAETSAAVAAQDAKIQAAAADIDREKQREREAQAMLDAAAQDTSRCRETVAARASELAQIREKERQGASAQSEAATAQQTANARVRIQRDETERAQARLREIEKMLEDQRREVERHQGLEVEAEAALAAAEAKGREAEAALQQLQQDTKYAADQLSVIEQDLSRAQEREREHGVSHIQARDAVSRAQARKDAEERELAACKDREAGRRAVEADATRVVESQASTLHQLEQENREHNEKRQRTEDEERELLLQEIRIREQRDNLEKEEAALRDSHRSFHSQTGRADQPPPPRASPRIASAAAHTSVHRSPRRAVALPPPPPGADYLVPSSPHRAVYPPR